jgi:hypothetical protein
LTLEQKLNDKIKNSNELPLFVLKNQENVDNDFEKEHCGSIFEIE